MSGTTEARFRIAGVPDPSRGTEFIHSYTPFENLMEIGHRPKILYMFSIQKLGFVYGDSGASSPSNFESGRHVYTASRERSATVRLISAN